MEPQYGQLLQYSYNDPNFDNVEQSVLAKLLELKDHYPIEATLSTLASNGKRYSSNPMTLHRHRPVIIKAQLFTSINEKIEKDLWNAAEVGNFSSIDSVATTLTVRHKKRRGTQCPKCLKWYLHHFNDHLRTCGEGRWCNICRTEQPDLDAHKAVCEGNLYPCRVCGCVLITVHERTVHETECRRPDSSATARNVRPRQEDPDSSTDLIPDGVEEQTAIDGLFRKISLTPPAGTGTDYEGALIDQHPLLVSILQERRGKFPCFYFYLFFLK